MVGVVLELRAAVGDLRATALFHELLEALYFLRALVYFFLLSPVVLQEALFFPRLSGLLMSQSREHRRFYPRSQQ